MAKMCQPRNWKMQNKIFGNKFWFFAVIDKLHSRAQFFFQKLYFGFANLEADTSVSEKIWMPDGTDVSAS